MSSKNIRVMVVDDASVIRGMLAKIIDAEPDMNVVTTAPDGEAALKQLEKYEVDLVTLDIEMPKMDGLQTLKEIRKKYPSIKVIMITSINDTGAKISLQCLSIGASEFIPKPSAGGAGGGLNQIKKQLIDTIRALTKKKLFDTPKVDSPEPISSQGKPSSTNTLNASLKKLNKPRVLLIGSSTGGPNALRKVLGDIDQSFQLPILITQHMPPKFTKQLAIQLQEVAGRPSQEAEDKMTIGDGKIYVAPGDYHMVVRKGVEGKPFIGLNQEPPENFCRPAVDPLFRTAASVYGPSIISCILTGMGEDGKRGSAVIADQGGLVIAQDEATSTVWGMPGAVVNAGLADTVLPLESIGKYIMELAKK